MKVLACIILVLASAAALGSGPYLPSGWRPDGPAFLLPGEVAKSVATTQEPQESEASGSDFLREYGPPKVQEVSQDLTQQALPDFVTEQSFVVIDARFNQDEDVKTEAGITEETTQENFTTEHSVTAITTESEVEKSVTEIEQVVRGKYINFDIDTDTTLASILEEATTENLPTTQDTVNANIVSVEQKVESEIKEVEQKVEKVFETELKTIEERVGKAFDAQFQAVEEKIEKGVQTKAVEEVNNIAEALVILENEIEAQVETVQEVAEVKSVQETSGVLEQVPEGFLEYGPPGFREYGPPKDELLRSEPLVEAKPISAAVQTNETRRRRFSPKFRQTPRRKQ